MMSARAIQCPVQRSPESLTPYNPLVALAFHCEPSNLVNRDSKLFGTYRHTKTTVSAKFGKNTLYNRGVKTDLYLYICSAGVRACRVRGVTPRKMRQTDQN